MSCLAGNTHSDDKSGNKSGNSSAGDNGKSPSKTNIRVLEIMTGRGQQNGTADAAAGGGVKEQPSAPPASPEGPQVVTAYVPPPPTVSSELMSPMWAMAFSRPCSYSSRGPHHFLRFGDGCQLFKRSFYLLAGTCSIFFVPDEWLNLL